MMLFYFDRGLSAQHNFANTSGTSILSEGFHLILAQLPQNMFDDIRVFHKENRR